MTDTAVDRLAAYYAIPGFLKWYTEQGFQRIDANNASRYYMLFHHAEMCRLKKCPQCMGWQPSYQTEDDVLSGKLTSKRCIVYEEHAKQSMAKETSRKMRVPQMYRETDWCHINATISAESRHIIENYIKNFPHNVPPGLYIHGKGRIGKTSSLWIITKALIMAHRIYRGVLVRSMPLLLSHLIKDEFSEFAGNPIFEEAMSCDLLILDDFGREKQTEWSFQKVFAILEERCHRNLPTICASAFPSDPLLWKSPFEKAMIDRIIEITQPVDLTLEAPDESGGTAT